MCIQKDTGTGTDEKFGYLTADIAQIEVGRQRVGHVHASLAAGIDDDVRAIGKALAESFTGCLVTVEEPYMGRENQVVAILLRKKRDDALPHCGP
ncbi:hypothetical protein AA0472_1335 [Acetobacter estunensis NRIC 0472]|nr:hypothetical protein AA0472_1335 [Acetobacter estunensis NRIC 0472]